MYRFYLEQSDTTNYYWSSLTLMNTMYILYIYIYTCNPHFLWLLYIYLYTNHTCNKYTDIQCRTSIICSVFLGTRRPGDFFTFRRLNRNSEVMGTSVWTNSPSWFSLQNSSLLVLSLGKIGHTVCWWFRNPRFTSWICSYFIPCLLQGFI